MNITAETLYKLLAENNYVERAALDRAVAKMRGENITLWEALLSLDLISDANLGQVVADYLHFPFIDLSKVAIPQEILGIVPEEVAMRNRVIAFLMEPSTVSVATTNPENQMMADLIGKKADRRPLVYFATERMIEEALTLYKNPLRSAVTALIKKYQVEEGAELPVIKIVDALLESAYDEKASDIHIEPKRTEGLARFRIDGILSDRLRITKKLQEQILTGIKVVAKLRTDEHLSAQDGRMRVMLPREELDVRVSIVPTIEGESIVLRLLSSRSKQFGLMDLGLTDDALARVKDAAQKPYGMILSTGPTGSGKTTTIYSILKILNSRERNIDTIEDPVEYEIDGVNQIQVNPKTNLTFAEGLRSILRQDPDIIYVGEIRDEETADIAINSAMTGHLVLSTLHTNDAATALPRLIDMGVEPFLVASTVNVILGQRLVRRVCDKCKVSYPMQLATMMKEFPADLVRKHFGESGEVTLFHGKGCTVCNGSGYAGRVGLFEVLTVSDAIKELIVAKADASVVARKAVEEGMTTMMEDGIKKVQQGVTTLEEVLRVTMMD